MTDVRDAIGKARAKAGPGWSEFYDMLDGLVAENARLRERVDALRSALTTHHGWHLEIGTLGICKDDDDQWIEVDMSAEYADSVMCKKTLEALSHD